jgi:hypothetical protein
MPIQYRLNAVLQAKELAALFLKSGIRRPAHDLKRIRRMIDHANLMVTAWEGEQGVNKAFQHQGIRRELVRRVRVENGWMIKRTR